MGDTRFRQRPREIEDGQPGVTRADRQGNIKVNVAATELRDKNTNELLAEILDELRTLNRALLERL